MSFLETIYTFRYFRWYTFNTRPNNKILFLSKLKSFSDEKFNVAKMMISLFDKVEKPCEKRRKCLVANIFPCSIMFSKAVCFRVVKTRDFVVKFLLHSPELFRSHERILNTFCTKEKMP